MAKLSSRVRRKALQTLNRIVSSDRAEMSELMDLIGRSPSTRADLAEWAARAQTLIHRLVLTRITKEDLALVLAGLISYRQTGITPESSHLALTRAFENSSGMFQEILHRALFEKLEDPRGGVHSRLFGDVAPEQIDAIVTSIRTDGYALLEPKVGRDVVEQVKSESRRFSYELKGGKQSGASTSSIDPDSPPECISAYADAESKQNSTLLQAITNDELFVSVASRYLGCVSAPIDSTFWYTFPHATPSSETAQLFHYDLDTIRWIKVFIYFSDVGAGNGPHEYVESSHRPDNKAPQILMRNYARIDDKEVDQLYPGKRRQVTGSAGTVIIGDTRCFHKGNAVESGYRLIFSPLYAPSRIGYFHG